MALEPYASHTQIERVPNDVDGIYTTESMSKSAASLSLKSDKVPMWFSSHWAVQMYRGFDILDYSRGNDSPGYRASRRSRLSQWGYRIYHLGKYSGRLLFAALFFFFLPVFLNDYSNEYQGVDPSSIKNGSTVNAGKWYQVQSKAQSMERQLTWASKAPPVVNLTSLGL